jgi:hypothetical protein
MLEPIIVWKNRVQGIPSTSLVISHVIPAEVQKVDEH